MANILLLEPDRKLADTYAGLFEMKGHTVMKCATAQNAIFAADERKPDVVIIELQLVAHGGIEFLYEFRSYTDWQNVPAVILSHVPANELAKSSKMLTEHLGVHVYHYKPRTSLKKLLYSVEEVLLNTSQTMSASATIGA